MSDKSEVTLILDEIGKGKALYDKLYPLVYDELKNIAGMRIQMEDPGHTYTKTELVHEVYIKVVDQEEINFKNRSHFLAVASICMRQILVDYARMKKAEKRGGGQKDKTYVDGLFSKYEEKEKELLDIDEALDRLAKLNQRLSDVVTMRFFGEMKIEEIAEALDVSESTVNRDWLKARGWLYKELQ